jgi:hypothetical protein
VFKKIFGGIGLAVVVIAAGLYGALRYYQFASRDPVFFEDDIVAFEAADRENPPAAGSVVFTGSSSIRRWSTLERDMAPIVSVNRGFGGSQVSHLVHFADRIVTPYAPRAVVVYSGGNDLDASTGKSAPDVVDDYREFARRVHSAHPETPIYILSIKPTILRFGRWPLGLEANRALSAWAAGDSQIIYLDVASAMLDADGQPRDELFVFDGLHLNSSGYALWTDVVRTRLLADLEGGAD